MAENTIKTRIQLKNDTEDNWDRAVNFIPKRGELIIYNAETGQNIDEARRFPRFKVGDGTTTVPNLPFMTGIGDLTYTYLEHPIAQKVQHTLTFGAHQAFTYDGSQDVTVPVYGGTAI